MGPGAEARRRVPPRGIARKPRSVSAAARSLCASRGSGGGQALPSTRRSVASPFVSQDLSPGSMPRTVRLVLMSGLLLDRKPNDGQSHHQIMPSDYRSQSLEAAACRAHCSQDCASRSAGQRNRPWKLSEIGGRRGLQRALPDRIHRVSRGRPHPPDVQQHWGRGPKSADRPRFWACGTDG